MEDPLGLGGFRATAPQPRQETKKKSGGLYSLIPTGGGIGGALGGAAAGAAIGSVVPVVGTGIGGLIGAVLGGGGGSALGKYAQNRIEGVDDASEGVLKEGLIGGATSLPFLSSAKVAKGAAQLGRGVLAQTSKEAAKRSFQEAGQAAIPKMAKGLSAKASKEVAEGILPRVGSSSKIVGGISRAARDKDMAIAGLTPSAKLTPKRAEELYDFSRAKGVNPGSPLGQAREVQRVFDESSEALASRLDAINRPLTSSDKSSLVNTIRTKMTQSKGVGSKLNTDTEKFIRDIEAGKDIKGLEALRREADDIVYTNTGAKKTIAAKQAKIIRDTIDEYVTSLPGVDKELSAAYKAAKKDFIDANDLLRIASSNASKTGESLEFLGTKIPSSQATANVRSKIFGRAAREPQFVDTTAETLANGAKGAGILGAIARESLGGVRPMLNSAESSEAIDNDIIAQDTQAIGSDIADIGAMEQDTSPFSEANIQNLILQDLQGNGGKNLPNLIKLYETFGKPADAKSKLTSTQATRAAAAQNALNDIPLIEEAIASGNLGAAKALPGAKSALGRRLLGTEDLDAALFNIADNILRARSGAAAPEAEVRRFVETFLPGPLDSEEAKQRKLDRAVRELQGFVNPNEASQGMDVLQAIQGVTQ